MFTENKTEASQFPLLKTKNDNKLSFLVLNP